MRRRFSLFALIGLFALAGFVGCAAVPGGGTLQFSSTGSLTSGNAVTVNVDASPLSGDRREVFLAHAGSQKIAAKVLEKLSAPGRRNDGSFDALDIAVTQFRLRSGATGFWLGWYAGADTLHVPVDVMSGGSARKSFQTQTSTAVAGIIRPGSVERLDRMVESLAGRIVEGI